MPFGRFAQHKFAIAGIIVLLAGVCNLTYVLLFKRTPARDSTKITVHSEPRQAVFLRLNYKEGEEMVVSTKITANMQDMIQVNDHKEIKFKVAAVHGDVFDFDVNVLRIYYESNDKMDGASNYDSSEPFSEMSDDEQEMHMEYKEILDSTLKLSLNSRGEVVKPFSFSDGRKPAANEPFEMGTIQLVFPQDSIMTGDTWTNEREVPLVSAKVKSNLTMTKSAGSEIVIALEGSTEHFLGKTPMKGQYFLDGSTKKLKSARLEMQSPGGGDIVMEVSVQ